MHRLSFDTCSEERDPVVTKAAQQCTIAGCSRVAGRGCGGCPLQLRLHHLCAHVTREGNGHSLRGVENEQLLYLSHHYCLSDCIPNADESVLATVDYCAHHRAYVCSQDQCATRHKTPNCTLLNCTATIDEHIELNHLVGNAGVAVAENKLLMTKLRKMKDAKCDAGTKKAEGSEANHTDKTESKKMAGETKQDSFMAQLLLDCEMTANDGSKEKEEVVGDIEGMLYVPLMIYMLAAKRDWKVGEDIVVEEFIRRSTAAGETRPRAMIVSGVRASGKRAESVAAVEDENGKYVFHVRRGYAPTRDGRVMPLK